MMSPLQRALIAGACTTAITWVANSVGELFGAHKSGLLHVDELTAGVLVGLSRYLIERYPPSYVKRDADAAPTSPTPKSNGRASQ